MSTNKFLASVVQWLDQHNIQFKPIHRDDTVKIRKVRKMKGGNLQVVFEDGVKLVVRGAVIARDIINAPFDLLIRGLNSLLPSPQKTTDVRPIVITLFSLFSLFSVFGLFSLVRLL